MNGEAIHQALSSGAPLTCATCRHFHEGNGHCGKQSCGGPARGLDFPDYEGPVPREKFSSWCLICGCNTPAFLIMLGEAKTRFALCKKHRKVYDHIHPPSPDQLKHPVLVIQAPE